MPQSIIDAIVAISNSDRCLRAFHRHGLRPPIEIVREADFRIAGRGILGTGTSSTPRAARLLGWTPEQVDRARNAFNRDRGSALTLFLIREYTADYSYSGIPTAVFNASALRVQKFGGARDITTHTFIHLGGQPGIEGGEHDLENYGPYNEILEACRR